jgi:hypothetical protein
MAQLLKDFNISGLEYRSRKPFPHMYMDNFLEEKSAKDIQGEIMNLPEESFDRYDNPFESKCVSVQRSRWLRYHIKGPFKIKYSNLVGILKTWAKMYLESHLRFLLRGSRK